MKLNIDKKIYCKKENCIYKVSEISVSNNVTNYGYIGLELIKFFDYINPDENNIQGWGTPKNAIEELQYDSLLWYMLNESIIDCIISDGYEIIKLASDEIE